MAESAFGVEVGFGGLSTLMRVVVVVLGDVVEVGGPGGAFAAGISAVTIADPDVFIQCGRRPVGVGGLMGGQRDGAVVVGGGAVGDEGSDDGVGALGEVADVFVGDGAVSVHESDTDLHLGIGVGVAGAAVGLLVAVGLLAVGLFACVGLVVGWGEGGLVADDVDDDGGVGGWDGLGVGDDGGAVVASAGAPPKKWTRLA